MANMEKGTIASINGTKAKVLTPAGVVTSELVIPRHLRGASGNLSKGVAVVYVEFEDRTGLIMGRADGEWSYQHTHPYSWSDGAGSGNTGTPN